MTGFDRITVRADQMGGVPCIRGLRIPVASVVAMVADLGLSGTAMGVGVFTGARHEEVGMISGASATGHEIGGTLGIAIYASIATAASGGIFVGTAAAAGIAHAFLIAGLVALGVAVAAIALLPAAKTFLPKLRLAPAMPVH
jgi:hypothetical protein